MPRKAKTDSAAATAIPTEATLENFWNEILARDDDYPAKFRDATGDYEFFDLLQELPEAVWDSRLLIYIYRLDPVIKNKSGEKSYLVKVAYPIDEEWIRKQYGGGKYHLYLKDGRDTLKEAKPRLEGMPKLDEGQTIAGATAAPAAPQPAERQSELAQVLDATSKASNAGIEIMQKGMEGAIDLQKKMLEKTAGLDQPAAIPSAGDKLLESLLPRLLEKPDPLALLTQVMTLVKQLTPAAAAPTPQQPTEPLNQQLETVKSLLGVESISEVFQKMNPRRSHDDTPTWIPSLLDFGRSLLEKAPELLLRIQENREMAFRQALLAHQIQNGGQLPPGVVVPPVTPRVAQPAAQPAPAPINGTARTLGEIIPLIVNSIAGGYDNEYEGWQVAAAIDVQFPGVMGELRPMLGDPAALTQFVAGIPILAERSTKEDWPDFQKDFLEYVNDNYADQPAAPQAAVADGPKAVASPGAA